MKPPRLTPLKVGDPWPERCAIVIEGNRIALVMYGVVVSASGNV